MKPEDITLEWLDKTERTNAKRTPGGREVHRFDDNAGNISYQVQAFPGGSVLSQSEYDHLNPCGRYDAESDAHLDPATILAWVEWSRKMVRVLKVRNEWPEHLAEADNYITKLLDERDTLRARVAELERNTTKRTTYKMGHGHGGHGHGGHGHGHVRGRDGWNRIDDLRAELNRLWPVEESAQRWRTNRDHGELTICDGCYCEHCTALEGAVDVARKDGAA